MRGYTYMHACTNPHYASHYPEMVYQNIFYAVPNPDCQTSSHSITTPCCTLYHQLSNWSSTPLHTGQPLLLQDWTQSTTEQPGHLYDEITLGQQTASTQSGERDSGGNSREQRIVTLRNEAYSEVQLTRSHL